MSHAFHFFSRLLALCFLLSATMTEAAEPRWIRLNSSHFTLVTNAEEERGGHEAIARFEQMRSAFGQLLMRSRISLSEPIEIIALRGEDDYSAVVPGRPGPLVSDAFFLHGDDRYYFVLNLSRNDSWRAISYDFAKVLLNYNYPPTQPWFDEGFAEYFSSLRFGKSVQIGWEPVSVADRSTSFTPLLASQPWMPMAQLFSIKAAPSASSSAPRDAMFRAQSWIAMHYLINKNLLEQTGAYFDLTLNQDMPADQAIQQAYGMSAAQFDQAVKTYYQSIAAQLQGGVQPGKGAIQSLGQAPTVAADEEIGASRQELSDEVGQSLVAEMALRVPERREKAIGQLNAIISQPKLDNAVAHRALAFAFFQAKDSAQASAEISKAAELDRKDSWLHFYAAFFKYHFALAGGHELQGLANMMQDLHAVLDWYPEFAEAYNMLGLARVEGGGINSAMEAEQAAIRLSPRNQQYQLNMAKIYIAAKKWEAASARLRQLAVSSDPAIAQAASKQLADLPMLQKYGVAPQPEAAAKPTSPPLPAPPAPPKISAPAPESAPSSDSGDENSDQPPPEPQPDRRPVQYVKGRLLSIDCSHAPVAIVTLSAAGKNLKLRAEDYKSLTLIDASPFSCDWKSRAASANYKAGGKADGDLVSLEVH
jgi:tetratricopeptide (TPR) repeat protein